MKAKVKATGEIVDIYEQTLLTAFDSNDVRLDEVEFLEEDTNFTPNYWTRFEHQYAGMAMQGLMSYVEQITPKKGRSFCDEIVDISFKVAHALVEKMRGERK